MVHNAQALASCDVYTPPPLARAMVTALGNRPSDRWLDPCVGRGVFLHELANLGVSAAQVTAIDIAQPTEPCDPKVATFHGVDFIGWSQATDQRFDKIVANPPYLALSRLDASLLMPVLALTTPTGTPLGRNANYLCAFVYAAMNLLRPGAAICFVLPAAWEYADYASQLRESVPQHFSRFHIHRSRKPLFDGIQDGSVVIIGWGFGERNAETRRFEHHNREQLVSALLDDSPVPPVDDTTFHPAALAHDLQWPTARPLGEVLTVHLGGVTGDVNYFLMSEDQRSERELPLESVRSVVSRAGHLASGELTQSAWESLRDSGERIWLFYPPDHLLDHKAVRAYLGLMPSQGGCHQDRYKIRSRWPWYRTLLPAVADGFASGMSKYGPWISLRGMPELTATNTLYVIQFRYKMDQDAKAAWALSLLTSVARQQLHRLGRAYQDGLVKHEQSDLNRVMVPIPSVSKGAQSHYLAAVRFLLEGEPKKSQGMADQWFERMREQPDI